MTGRRISEALDFDTACCGPDATDLARPDSMGGTIISRTGQLRSGIDKLLSASPGSQRSWFGISSSPWRQGLWRS